MLPTFVLFAFFSYVIGDTIALSFFNWDGLNPKQFIGALNFTRLFADYRFLVAMRNIGILIMMTIVVQVGLGVLLAFILSDLSLRFSSFFKTVIFMPVVVSNIAVSLYFLTLYDYQYGTINYILSLLGLDRRNILASGVNTIYWAILPQTWQYIGLMFIVAYTAFTTVSRDHVDAAKLDGLSAYQRLFHLYVPISWSSLSVCFIIALVGPLKAFEHIWIVTTGGGSDQMSHVPGTLMYYIGFSGYEYGYGAAIASFIFIFALLLVGIFRVLSRGAHTEN